MGVSRTSKTPLSVFLALKGFRVSNVPIVLDQDPPEELYHLDQRRVFGLTIDPESLRDIRRERLETMRVASRTNYDDMDYILAELEWCEDIFRRHPEWPVIDVTRRAVEETAANILRSWASAGWDATSVKWVSSECLFLTPSLQRVPSLTLPPLPPGHAEA